MEGGPGPLGPPMSPPWFQCDLTCKPPASSFALKLSKGQLDTPTTPTSLRRRTRWDTWRGNSPRDGGSSNDHTETHQPHPEKAKQINTKLLPVQKQGTWHLIVGDSGIHSGVGPKGVARSHSHIVFRYKNTHFTSLTCNNDSSNGLNCMKISLIIQHFMHNIMYFMAQP